jgi:MFS family permease
MAGPAAPLAGVGNGVAEVSGRVWPSSSSAYWALFVIILATFMIFFDGRIFSMFAEQIKKDFGLTDSQLGFLAGPAGILIYLFVGIPLARLADIYPRKYVLAGGAAVVGSIVSLGGLAQNFGQFISSRVFLSAGGSAHAPASYSLLADAFPPKKLTRAFALLQFGFIGGGTLGALAGGQLAQMAPGWAPLHFAGLTILGWQLVFLLLGLPSLLIGLLFLTVKEPPRFAPAANTVQVPKDASLGRRVLTFMGLDALKAINAKPKVYYPLFAALALSALDSFGLGFWQTPFMMRTYGWTPAQIGQVAFIVGLAGSLLGLVLGGVLVEWLSKKHKDANVRAAAILFSCVTICTISAIVMPNGLASMILFAAGAMFGIAGAVPQNAAVQRIAPNDMRGQVTAFYLFMFTAFGALGSWVVGRVQDIFIQVEADLWKAMLIVAGTLLPLATLLMYRAIKPYREEVERLEALEKEALNV